MQIVSSRHGDALTTLGLCCLGGFPSLSFHYSFNIGRHAVILGFVAFLGEFSLVCFSTILVFILNLVCKFVSGR